MGRICVGGPEDGRVVPARGFPAFLMVKGNLYRAERDEYLFAGHTHRRCAQCGCYHAHIGSHGKCALCGGLLVDASSVTR